MFVGALSAGCSGGGGDTASTTAALLADGLRTELEGRGHSVVPLGVSERSLLSVGVEWWCASDIIVGVHEYADGDATRRDIARLEDPEFLAGTDFAAPPHFYAHDRLIVEVAGAHDVLAPTLVELLGHALAVDAFGFDPTLPCDELAR
jgi:hypothetical protein